MLSKQGMKPVKKREGANLGRGGGDERKKEETFNVVRTQHTQ